MIEDVQNKKNVDEVQKAFKQDNKRGLGMLNNQGLIGEREETFADETDDEYSRWKF